MQGHSHNASALEKNVRLWLGPFDHEARHQRIQKTILNDSGTWLRGNHSFQQWMTEVAGSRLLWIRGRPGAGKTFLSSSIASLFRTQFYDAILLLRRERGPTKFSHFPSTVFYCTADEPTKWKRLQKLVGKITPSLSSKYRRTSSEPWGIVEGSSRYFEPDKTYIIYYRRPWRV